MDELHEVLEADPTNMKAIYVLQLACVRGGQRDEVAGLDRPARSDLRALSASDQGRGAVRTATTTDLFPLSIDGDLTSAIEAYQKAKAP